MNYRIADYIADALVRHGITHVFTVTGGGAMHLNHAFATHPKLTCIYLHHEQACAYAAEGFYRVSGRMAAVCVTTGPGALNAITGVHAAWVDSIPMVVISGQVKRATLAPDGLRQLGDQEAPVVEMVRHCTKAALLLDLPKVENIIYGINLTLACALHRRPGPVWLDVPGDVQAMACEPASGVFEVPACVPPVQDQEIFQVIVLLRTAKRPVIYVGQGIRASGQHETLLRLLGLLQIPCVTTWNSLDLIPNGHSCYAGRPGTVGTRPGNFAVQNADLLLILGCRLNLRQISYVWSNFAPKAFKVMVDADEAELTKPTLKIDLKVHADLRDFLPRLEKCHRDQLNFDLEPLKRHYNWTCRCRAWVAAHPVVTDEARNAAAISPYVFTEELFKALPANATVVCGDGTASVCTFQAADIKPGQRVFHNSGSAPMGYDLPAAIGAALADPSRLTVCVTGDGSIMQNLQELQSIVGLNLPIKIFVLSNGGYRSIQQTQENYFKDSAAHGCGPGSGLTFPDFSKIARAFQMGFIRLKSGLEMHLLFDGYVFCKGEKPVIMEIMLDPTVAFAPKLASRQLADGSFVTPPLEDMSPFLPREELAAVMKISE